VDKEVLIKKVLRSLTPRWNHIAIIIEESKDLSTLQFDLLVGSPMSHEERLIDSFRKSGEKSFSSKLQITKNEYANTSNKINQSQGRSQNQNYSREERAVQEVEAEADLIEEISSAIIVKGMVTLIGIVDSIEGNNNKDVNYAQEGDEASSNNLFLSYDKAENGTKDV
jgi:hypothetical protein